MATKSHWWIGSKGWIPTKRRCNLDSESVKVELVEVPDDLPRHVDLAQLAREAATKRHARRTGNA